MSEKIESLNFIEQIIEEDLGNGFPKEKLKFRFPPEPNGYLHIGHAKAICINFGLGKKYNAPVNLRFDDTNPAAEEQEFVDSIKEDVQWLGFQWENELYTSDYFQQLYDWAIELIKQGKAYVDDQPSETIVEQRKKPGEPGIESPFRNRTVEENITLFKKMKAGEVEEGKHVLRAKIDMNSPNMNLRDPVMYRVLKKAHHRTHENWNIYPMYDWAHGESDYVEQISHSLCSLEFKPHRPLYNWYLDQVVSKEKVRPKQREFARGNVGFTVTSKRKLRQLVEEGLVNGWDDPRMPTISGLRRRGFTPESIQLFWEKAGVAKRENIIDYALLEFSARDHLNEIAPRYMAVLNPVKLIIENYPENQVEYLENDTYVKGATPNQVPFSRELLIEREDYKEEAGRKFWRLTNGKEVRLKSAYIIKGERCEKDENGNITTIYCTYDPKSKSGSGTEESKRKVKGTLHWVSAQQALPIEVRLYDRLFTVESPDGDKSKDFREFLNPNSLQNITAYGEPALKNLNVGEVVQFQRMGYFAVDKDSTEEKMVFNRTVTLRDTWKGGN